jgi:imidazolonepropionase-like amidohydrolase
MWASLPETERPALPARLQAAADTLRLMSGNITRMYAAGLPIAVGTDAGNIGTQHGPGFHRELRLLSRAGFTPMEIIIAATRNGARALGQDKDLGTLQVGKFADLLLLDSNPLEDVENLDRIVQIMIRGKMTTRGDLNSRLTP